MVSTPTTDIDELSSYRLLLWLRGGGRISNTAAVVYCGGKPRGCGGGVCFYWLGRPSPALFDRAQR